MEDIKEKGKETLKVVTDEKSVKNKKFLYLFPIAILMLGLVVVGFLWRKEETREDMVSFVDRILLSNENNLNETDNIEKELLDLPEGFLESEVVQEEAIDTALEELDQELKNISTLDSDFVLDSTDVGL